MLRLFHFKHESMNEKTNRIYYHIIEDCGYGRLGYQGYRDSKEEAEAEIKRLSEFFPKSYFEIFLSDSENEPPVTTI